MSKVRFGPAGIGKISEIAEGLKYYEKLGFGAAEIPFTYGIFIKKDRHKKEIKGIRTAAKRSGISLSIHAPYWVNLNSDEEEKVEASKKRILDSCEVAHLLSIKKVVFHAGFYGKGDRELAYNNIKVRILEMQDFIKESGWSVELCPEVMGKKNVFGSIEEISGLVRETGCSFCLDISHSLARYGEYPFEKMKKAFPQKNWHCHFSGIEYGEKGERKHIMADVSEWRKILKFLKGLGKSVTLICESPDTVGDSVVGLKVWESL
jgi:deoxyribonuclease-4